MDTRPLDNKMLLMNSITLLYRESQLPGANERSSNLVRSAMSLIKLPENVQLTLDPITQTLDGLKRMAMRMADDPQEHTYEENEVLQQIKLICGEDTNFFESFERGIVTELKENSIKKTCLNMRRSLMNHLRNENVKTVVHKANVALVFKPETIPDMRKFVGELVAELEPYQQDAITTDPAIVSQVSFGNLESISKVFKDVKEEADGSSILRTGWQGINRMLRGGGRRGEEWIIPALPHMNKSGFALDIFRQINQYNVPLMIDRQKTPLNVFFSFENTIEQNMRYIYCKLMANQYRKAVSEAELTAMPIEEISKYVYDAMRVNGYEAEMLRVDPTRWGYRDLCNKILEFEAEGYEVHSCVADYLYMLQTTGCTQGPAGHDVRDMFRRVRNFFNPRKILFMTPHQISTGGKQLIREGKTEFVKELPGKGYFAGSGQIDQEVDGELYLHIERVNGRAYQTYQRGKHRIVGQTPPIDQYCVHLFDPLLGILDDVEGPDTTLRKVGGGPIGSGEETPFWMPKEKYAEEVFA